MCLLKGVKMDKITVKIKINEDFKIFEYDGDLNIPVTTLLERLDCPIEYDCSCLQGLCGACAMVINSKPKLACKSFLNDEIQNNVITIEPLSKFPLVKDLKVNRHILYDVMSDSELWLESKADISGEIDFEYEMSLCLMCGCCCEACPNYGETSFVGTPVAVSASKLLNIETNQKHIDSIKKNYKNKFYNHCVKSLVCEEICPMKIPTQRAISKMNKKSVWRLWQLFNWK